MFAIHELAGKLTVDHDAEGLDGFFSIWFNQNRSGAEVAGRIGERNIANLFAAAPDLFIALQRLLRGDVDSIDNARAAIAKARGGKAGEA